MNHEAALLTRRLDAGATLTQATPWHREPVTLASPAVEVMTDLQQVKAAMVVPQASLHEAEQTMIYQGVRMLFVVTTMPMVEGLITTTDLRGDLALRMVTERGLHHDELTVADVMTPIDALDAIDLADLRIASVSNVIATLKAKGRNHLLVVERDDGAQRVRGVISRAQVERQLGQPITITEIAGTFAEIRSALA